MQNPRKKKELDAQVEISEGEYSTIQKLHQYCTNATSSGKQALVYYFHSKSTGSPRDFVPVSDPLCDCCRNPQKKPCPCCNPPASWREGMNAFNLEFPSICARALLTHGYSACGIENQDAHYSGNFWWADCAHVASLDIPRTRFDPWMYEFFILGNCGKIQPNFGYTCGYSAHNCYVNRYDYECPREWYRQHIIKQVAGGTILPPSTRAKPNHIKLGHNASTEGCRALKGGIPYGKNPLWRKYF